MKFIIALLLLDSTATAAEYDVPVKVSYNTVAGTIRDSIGIPPLEGDS